MSVILETGIFRIYYTRRKTSLRPKFVWKFVSFTKVISIVYLNEGNDENFCECGIFVQV